MSSAFLEPLLFIVLLASAANFFLWFFRPPRDERNTAPLKSGTTARKGPWRPHHEREQLPELAIALSAPPRVNPMSIGAIVFVGVALAGFLVLTVHDAALSQRVDVHVQSTKAFEDLLADRLPTKEVAEIRQKELLDAIKSTSTPSAPVRPFPGSARFAVLIGGVIAAAFFFFLANILGQLKNEVGLKQAEPLPGRSSRPKKRRHERT